MDTFWGLTGQLLAGGYLNFYSAGTTNPKHVYADNTLADGTDNGTTVALDASGRPSVDIWGSGSYFVELYDADDVKQGEADNVEIPGGAAQTIPIPDPGEFLTGDGTNILVAEIRQVPDPTGHADEVLSSDGATLTWIAKPADGADGTSDLDAVGLTDKTIRSGSATGTSSGGRTQDVAVTYSTPLGAAADFIGIEITSAALSTGGTMPSWSFVATSTTGFTVRFTMGEIDDTRSDFNFNAGVAFNYWAIGDA
jgi:hypothetical protein